MTTTTTHIGWPRHSLEVARSWGPTLSTLAVLFGVWLTVRAVSQHSPTQHQALSTTGGVADTGEVNDASPSTVVIPPLQLESARIEAEPVARQRLQHMHVVPGRIGYEESRHIDIKTSVDGIVQDMLVKPGDRVAEGQSLAVIHSPEVGRARAEVLNMSARYDLMRRRFDRESSLEVTLGDLLQHLDRGEDIATIEAVFSQRPLDGYRQDLMTAYAGLLLAQETSNSLLPLADSGSVPGRTIRERESARHVALAHFQSVRERAEFSAMMSTHKARADLADAERLLAMARQHVLTLLGHDDHVADSDSPDLLAQLDIHAPFAGTIESVATARSERVQASASILVLADTSRLYVLADIRESDWPAVMVAAGAELSLTIPALDGQTFCARVHYVGREVNRETNSIPLVALIDNPHGLLRPGMFTRITVPIGSPTEALAVHSSSLLQHENSQFVFVAVDHNTFRMTPVSTGITCGEWVEITDGLSAGEHVVTEGAFLLKSALLLQGESD